MVFIIVIAVIIFLIALLCFMPISLSLSYIDKNLNYKLKYAGITIFSTEKIRKPKKKKQKKKPQKEKPQKDKSDIKQENSDNSENIENAVKADTDKKKSDTKKDIPDSKNDKAEKKKNDITKMDKFAGIFENFSEIMQICGKALKKIFKGIKLTDLFVDIIVSNEDAYVCAMNYGKMNIAVYNILGFLSNLIKVKADKVRVVCEFNKPCSVYNIKFKISIRLGTIIGLVISIFYAYKTKLNKKEKA